MARLLSTTAAVAALAVALPAVASAGSISGRVTDDVSGGPVAGVRVGAGPVGYGLRDYTFTAADGSYEIGNLEAGRFNVCFLPEPGVNLLRECWDNSPTAYGDAISVPEAGAVENIHAALPPGTAVAGRVTSWQGDPLPGVCVSAWTPAGGGMRRAADATTDARGEYTVVGLEPGAPHKVVFAPVDTNLGRCADGVRYEGYVEQWFDREAGIETADEVTAARSETRAGVDGILGTSATPPPGSEPPAARCIVPPRLRGKTFATARRLLARAHCSTPMPGKRSSRSFRRGRVIESKPGPHKRIRRGARVKLLVSRGR